MAGDDTKPGRISHTVHPTSDNESRGNHVNSVLDLRRHRHRLEPAAARLGKSTAGEDRRRDQALGKRLQPGLWNGAIDLPPTTPVCPGQIANTGSKLFTLNLSGLSPSYYDFVA